MQTPQIKADNFTPNDPLYSEQWYLHSKSEANGSNWELAQSMIENMEAKPIKDTVRVAILDSGANSNHPELQTALWTNEMETINGLDDDENGYVDDIHGCAFTPEDDSCLDVETDLSHTQHGTGTAGLIGAEINNNQGIAAGGLGFNIEIVLLKVNQKTGVVNYSDVHDALNYIKTLDDIDVVSMNFAGWPFEDSTTEIDEVITQISEVGTVFVAGSGNSALTRSTIGWPAIHPKVLAVGGYNQNGLRRENANFGPELDLVAPAESIQTLCYEEDYCLQSGTSFSGPQVAVAAAFVKAYQPEATFEEVQQILHETAGNNFTEEYGYGLLDYYALFQELLLPNEVYLPVVNGSQHR